MNGKQRPTPPEPALRVVVFGTYDLDKPRNRQMLDALHHGGFDVHQVHYSLWEGVADKAVLGSTTIFARAVRALWAYPLLIARYLRAPPHEVAVVGYLGHFDVIVLRPFAWLRGVPVVWDVFISLYDTVVCDRRIVSRGSVAARILWAWEWVACRCADRLLIDTSAHALHMGALFGISPSCVSAVFVGAEAAHFPRLPPPKPKQGGAVTVLFYGQFIPLHGIATIIEAARIDGGERVRWRLVGRGQDRARILALIEHYGLENIEWEYWVPYQTLIDRIAEADVCLGIFGISGKAARVIPNKAFQVLATGRPLVTRDSPAMRELVATDTRGVRLVPPGDPEALLAAVLDLADSREQPPKEVSEAFGIDRISDDLRRLILEVCGRALPLQGRREAG